MRAMICSRSSDHDGAAAADDDDRDRDLQHDDGEVLPVFVELGSPKLWEDYSANGSASDLVVPVPLLNERTF